MTVAVELSPDQGRKLDEAARAEGLEPAVLLSRIAAAYLERRENFESAARHVLAKNAELYRRLAQ